jgi:hypothetical protein
MHPMLRGLAVVLVLATASAATAAPREKLSGEAELAKMLEGRVAGKPTKCIRLSDIQGSTIIDDTAIVYHMPGNELFVNRPRGGASHLREDDILLTKTYGGDLCSPEIVNLLDRTSSFPHGFVSLGQFVPYAKVKR